MIDQTIVGALVTNEKFARKVMPFIKPEYFNSTAERFVYNTAAKHLTTYNALPSKEALLIELANHPIAEGDHKTTSDLINSIEPQTTNFEWLIEQTEKFCQNRAIYNAINQSIQIFDGVDKTASVGAIPKLLSDALAVSFDTSIGHDFLTDFDQRYEFYHRKESKLAFDLDLFNTITGGGVSRKTLNIVLAGTGVGKTLFMCHCAAANLSAGANVLYITLEMAEERIAERIDANLLDTPIDQLQLISKENYLRKIGKIQEKTVGKLIIKEYPTASVGVSHFRYLLSELKLKRNFVPDIIYIDYLNLCVSSRIKYSNSVNSYTYIKAIAEELRGLAAEANVPIISATQVNRAGFTSSDIGLENTADSFGLPATADFMFALSSSEELASLNQIMVKQLKNRYKDENTLRRFVIGVDKSKMRLYNCEQSSQDDVMADDDKPVIDSGHFFEEDTERSKPKLKFRKRPFGEFK